MYTCTVNMKNTNNSRYSAANFSARLVFSEHIKIKINIPKLYRSPLIIRTYPARLKYINLPPTSRGHREHGKHYKTR